MGLLSHVWRTLTPTKALEKTIGELELAFFEPVYRFIYLVGFSSSNEGGFYFLYSIIIKLSIIGFVSCELWCLYDATGVDDVIEIIYVTLIHLIAIYRYWILLQDKHIYKKLAMAMGSPNFDISTPGRRQIVEYWLSNNEKYIKVLLGLGSCTLAAWYLYPLLDDIEYNLAVTIKVPYDYQNPNLYGVTYAIVIFSFHYTAYFVMTNDLIMQAHLIHMLCQFAVLGDCFENIIHDCSSCFEDLDLNSLHRNPIFAEVYLRRLSVLVDQHQFILNNTIILRKILSKPMLGQFSASAMLICCAAYQVTAAVTAGITKFLMCLLYLCYSLFQLFIFCRWCDEIKVLSERIREAVYFSGWERVAMVPGVRARLMLVIARASRPLVLTAGGLYELSLTSYATLVKTSYSALTVLLRTQHDSNK